jgi:regulator of replication initiation timing
MEIDEFLKLEEKVNKMVGSVKLLKEENSKLKLEIEKLRKVSSGNDVERAEIKKKVTALIELIDSIEK